jgi:hypothetical protein
MTSKHFVDVIASTEIRASAERVWSVLTDLNQFAAWNPFIRQATGDTHVGGTVHVRVRPSFGLPLAFDATVLDRCENHELHWHGHVLARWLASGEHVFSIEPLGPDRVRFVQWESFSGVLPRLARRLLAREAKRGFDAMNAALRERAEEPVS